MNIHTTPEEGVNITAKVQVSPSASDLRASERYCTDCDIQFSSMKTFSVHKAHYCQTRHVLKGNKSPVREEIPGGTSSAALSALSSANSSNGQPVLALPTNPVLLVPYSMVAGAQLLPPHILSQHGAAIVLPNGQVHPLSANIPSTTSAVPPLLSPNVLSTSVATSASETSTVSQSSICSINQSSSSNKSSKSESSRPKSSELSGKRRGEGDSPLDLTTKRPKLTIKSDLLNDEEKENREINSCKSTSPSVKSSTAFSPPTGEFEGKLLASPPRPSPSSEVEDRSTPRSPRPASAAPSLSSPRSLAESPRPSTSAIAASKSPGQGSPGALPHQASLPAGFPNLLSSLENLSNLPLASLQCLQGLQGISPELALKLLNPEVLMNTLPPIMNPPVIVKQGEAKCNECNIVFFKEESLQVHKKHYCAAREKTEEDRRSTGSRSPAAAVEPAAATRSPPRDSPGAATSSAQTKDSAKPSKPLVQFICTACGIKFTSPDNLSAHQTYYCPKREGAGGDEGVTKGTWRCPRCRVAMPETLQAAHQCVTPTPAPSHGWKCPCCPVLSPTAAAAQKHLDTHAGIKAFRCTICGYRGNTLRGMRTHIRMHFEKRTSDLQEENFIACILEEDEIRSRSDTASVSDSSRILLENPNLSALLAESTNADHNDSPALCSLCPFVAPQRSILIQHISLAHRLDPKLVNSLRAMFDEQISSDKKTTVPSERRDSLENGNSNSPPIPAIKLEPEVKLEVQEGEEEDVCQNSNSNEETENNSHSSTPDSPRNIANGSPQSNGASGGGDTVRHCQICNITFAYVDNFLAHKQFYCTRPEANTPPETAVQ